MMIFAIAYAVFTQGGDAAITFLNNGIEKGLTLFLTLTPIMCFWSGIMEVADNSGITKTVSLLLSPLIRILFGKRLPQKAKEKISMNMSANLLGMGNAATPLGLEAMRELDSLNPTPERAGNLMCMFIIINTASIQLFPSSVIALRSQAGSIAPSDILLPTMITTLLAFLVGTISAKICARLFP